MIKFGKKANMVEETKMEDPTAWMLENIVADFLLMPGYTIYMCMLGYTFLVGCKVFKGVPSDASVAYKFVNMLFACLGGGVLVPIFLNGIPVPLASDAYILAILCSFSLHYYFPILREVVGLSKILKVILIIFYETNRAAVVVKLTYLAGSKIAASVFAFPVFGPIFCGTVGGSGGGFFPLSKGFEPIKAGLTPPAKTAFVGALCFHLYLNTSLSEGTIDAKKKAHVFLTLYFIAAALVSALGLTANKTKVKSKKE